MKCYNNNNKWWEHDRLSPNHAANRSGEKQNKKFLASLLTKELLELRIFLFCPWICKYGIEKHVLRHYNKPYPREPMENVRKKELIDWIQWVSAWVICLTNSMSTDVSISLIICPQKCLSWVDMIMMKQKSIHAMHTCMSHNKLSSIHMNITPIMIW